MIPQRIQLSRKKGWKMPPNTVIVDRRGRWGNPFVVGKDGTAAECVNKFVELYMPYTHRGPRIGMDDFYVSEANMNAMIADLKGKNLACWCKVGEPCHADWLLQFVNT